MNLLNLLSRMYFAATTYLLQSYVQMLPSDIFQRQNQSGDILQRQNQSRNQSRNCWITTQVWSGVIIMGY